MGLPSFDCCRFEWDEVAAQGRLVDPKNRFFRKNHDFRRQFSLQAISQCWHGILREKSCRSVLLIIEKNNFRPILRRKWVGGMYFGKFFHFWRKNVKWLEIRGDHFCIDFVEIRNPDDFGENWVEACTSAKISIFDIKTSRHWRRLYESSVQ